MEVFKRLVTSRRFWISALAVAINLGLTVLPPAYKPAIDAFNLFALALIAAYTLEDSAKALRQ